MVGRAVLPRPFIVPDSTKKAAACRTGLEEASQDSGWFVACGGCKRTQPTVLQVGIGRMHLVRSMQSHACGRGSRRPVALPNSKLNGRLGKTVHE